MIPFEFLNPEIQLAAKQAQSVKRPCTGCKYRMYLWDALVCSKHKGRAGAAVVMCPDFERKNTHKRY